MTDLIQRIYLLFEVSICCLLPVECNLTHFNCCVRSSDEIVIASLETVVMFLCRRLNGGYSDVLDGRS